MKLQDFHKQLISMGYRKVKDSVYAKPVGYSLNTVGKKENEEIEFCCWFMNPRNDTGCLWASKTFNESETTEDFMWWIRHVEAWYSRYNLNFGEFEFLTAEDYYSIVL